MRTEWLTSTLGSTPPGLGPLRAKLGRLMGNLRFGRSRWVVLFLPTVFAALYFFLIASDQYESEARFVVRSAARAEMPEGLSFLAKLGIGRSQDDSFVVQEFMTSRDAIERLQERLPLQAMFNRDAADFLARYPSILFSAKDERFYRYFQHMVSVIYGDKTGVPTLRVRAFRPGDAEQIAETLLALGEELVNHINHRLRTDMVANSESELRLAQARLMDAQLALTNFRNRELVIDPARNAVALGELISQLSAELGTTQAQITEMKVGSRSSPQLFGLQRKAAALEQQIGEERARIAGDTDGLASRISAYERLMFEREFAAKMLSTAETELARARMEANRQSLYLERVVKPHRADYSTYPKRVASVSTVAAANIILVLIGWLILSGIREHAAHGR